MTSNPLRHFDEIKLCLLQSQPRRAQSPPAGGNYRAHLRSALIASVAAVVLGISTTSRCNCTDTDASALSYGASFTASKVCSSSARAMGGAGTSVCPQVSSASRLRPEARTATRSSP
jgi:hypothetical protein